MAGTTLSDVIVPQLFTPYVIQKTMEKSALYNCGIIVNDTKFDELASQASPLVNMPFFEDLTGESEPVVEGKDLTPSGIESEQDVAVIIRRAKMWSATDLSAALAGSDPMLANGLVVAAPVPPCGVFLKHFSLLRQIECLFCEWVSSRCTCTALRIVTLMLLSSRK